jgi:hypothetical protein
VSASRQKPIVVREYEVAPDVCIRALALLLKTTASKKDGVRAAPDDAVKEFDGYDAYKNHNR